LVAGEINEPAISELRARLPYQLNSARARLWGGNAVATASLAAPSNCPRKFMSIGLRAIPGCRSGRMHLEQAQGHPAARPSSHDRLQGLADGPRRSGGGCRGGGLSNQQRAVREIHRGPVWASPSPNDLRRCREAPQMMVTVTGSGSASGIVRRRVTDGTASARVTVDGRGWRPYVSRKPSGSDRMIKCRRRPADSFRDRCSAPPSRSDTGGSFALSRSGRYPPVPAYLRMSDGLRHAKCEVIDLLTLPDQVIVSYDFRREPLFGQEFLEVTEVAGGSEKDQHSSA
jgi:hypothetical protein